MMHDGHGAQVGGHAAGSVSEKAQGTGLTTPAPA